MALRHFVEITCCDQGFPVPIGRKRNNRAPVLSSGPRVARRQTPKFFSVEDVRPAAITSADHVSVPILRSRKARFCPVVGRNSTILPFSRPPTGSKDLMVCLKTRADWRSPWPLTCWEGLSHDRYSQDLCPGSGRAADPLDASRLDFSPGV